MSVFGTARMYVLGALQAGKILRPSRHRSQWRADTQSSKREDVREDVQLSKQRDNM